MKKQARIVMCGLDWAGKTKLLYRVKLGEQVTTIPTIGFNVETVEFDNTEITIWDVGGQDKIRALWRHYYKDSQAIAFVVDATDHGRIQEASEVLRHVIDEQENKNVKLLIIANKIDLPAAMSQSEILDRLNLDNTPCFMCSAMTGDGIDDVLAWIADNAAIIGPQKQEEQVKEEVKELSELDFYKSVVYSISEVLEKQEPVESPLWNALRKIMNVQPNERIEVDEKGEVTIVKP